MARHLHRVPLTIPEAATEVEFKGRDALRLLSQATRLTIYVPDAVDGTVSVQVAYKEDPVAADWAPTDPATVLVVNTAKPLPEQLAAAALKVIQSIAAPAGGRTYVLVAQLDATLAL